MATTDKVPAIYGKVNEIRKKVGRIAKNGTGPQTQGSYKFLAIDDILEAVKPLEDELGVISYPVHHEVTFHYNTAADKNDGRVPRENVQGLVDFTFRYVAAEDGSHIDVSVPGEGIDSQDKATRKATTQAQKIANILLYNIITGEEDPDSQDGGAAAQNEPAGQSPAQRQIDKARAATPAAKGNSELEDLKKKVRDAIESGTVTREQVVTKQTEIKEATKKTGLDLQQELVKALGV